MKTVIRNSYTPKTGDYCETIVVDKESEDAYIFDCDGIFTPMPQPVDVEDILRRAAEYTDETVAPLEEKLDTIEEGAQVNVIETVTQNGQPLTVTDKTVNVTVPTKTSDLENDGSDGTDTYVESSTLDDYYTKSETDTNIGYETDAREIADAGLQEQIDAIVASSDVVDIVGTYAALQAYDPSKLHDNDIIKVLTDETRDDATTYYRWDADTSTWGYIGAEGPFYTKAESDALFTPMTRTINNKALSSDITLTAADVHALPDSTVIPTVNDATLTIQKNGTDVATFTANSASNQTANITVPVDTSDLNNDGDGQSPFATENYVDTYGGKIDTIEVNGTAQPIVNKTVDITVPTKTSDLTNDGSDGTDTYVEAGDLATVATSGDYDDLTNKPTIPTVNDATLTIQKNGTDVATFTANSSTNQTANITVPTDTSDLTNGAGFITNSALSSYYTKSETYSQNEVNSLINSLSIPSKTSDLTNDSGFITLTDIPTASANDLGLIRIGTGLSIDQDGIVSVTSAGSVDWDDVTNRPTDVSYWTNDAGYITSAAIPTNVSSFTNDAGYITSAAIPTNVSAFTNDAGYLTSSALSNYYTKSETYNQSQVNALINSISIPTKTSDLTNDGADGTSTYVESDDLAAVATSGSYNDLSNKPTIPTIVDMTGATSSTAGAHGYVPAPAAGDQNKFLQGDGTWATPADEIYTAGNGISIDANNEISVDTSVVATQTDLAGKQDTLTAGSNMTISNNVISAKVDSALSASSTNPVQNSVVKAALDGKADTSDLPTKTSDLTNDGSDGTSTYVETDDLATVATSGSYNDLTNKPTIPAAQVNSDWNASSGVAQILNKPSLAAVATSGSYNDLSDKPTIPTVNNGTLTIQKNGTDVQTFTANQSTNATANITVDYVKTADNLTPTADTTAAWKTAFSSKNGAYLTWYSVASKFTNQPSTYGFLETFLHGGDIYQRWYTQSRSGTILYRSGNASGWGNPSTGAWNTVATAIDIDNLDARPNSYWGTCTTAAATAAKVVTVSSSQNFKLVPGAMVTFKAPNTNTAQNPTINVNSTGAKPIWYNSAVVATSNLNKAGQINRPATYIYDGTNWVWASWSLDADTTYSTMSVSEGTTGTATSARTMRADYLKQIIEHYNPTNTSDLTNDGADGTSTYVEADQLATVATSGSYNDLSNKPTIPTVNDATLTIQKNGTNVQTFTANSSTNKTANIQVPNLQTSDTDPGEGSALAADTFLGIYDIAPEDVDGARLVDGSVTSSKIDWSTIVAGVISIGTMAAGRQERTVSIPTQANTDYVVLLTLAGAMTGGWTKISLSVASKTTSSFTMVNYNEVGYAVNNVAINYLVIPR